MSGVYRRCRAVSILPPPFPPAREIDTDPGLGLLQVKADLDKTESMNEAILNGNYVYMASQLEKAIDEKLPVEEIKVRQDRVKEAKRSYDEFVKRKKK